MPSAQMVFDVIARDGASGSFRAMSREANGAAASFDKVGKAAAGITVLFAAFAVNAAVKFESAMTRISTQAGVPIGQIKALSNAILGLSPKVGFNPDELATSLYHVESAFRTTGISAGKATDIVAQAAKLAKIGNADLESTTQAIIGVLASGIKGVKDATDAAAQLNQLVGAGDTTLSAVTKSIATGILPTASSLGLSFKDVAAALATLTDNATPADEAATRLRTTLSLVENPAPKATAALRSIGISSAQLAEDFRKPDGLLVALQDLKTHLDKTYSLSSSKPLSLDQITKAGQAFRDEVVAQGAATKEADKLTKKYVDGLKAGGSAATLQARVILQAFGGARSGATFLTLYNELSRLQSKYKDFGTSAQAAAKFQEAWANQQKTAKQKLDELKASWDVFLVQAGNAILPTLKKIVDVLAKHPGIIKAAAAAVGLLAAAWVGGKIAGAIKAANTLARAILGVGAASTTAAAESEAAAGASVAAGAGAGAAEGAAAGGLFSRLGKKFPVLRIAVPVVATVASIKILGLEKTVRDLIHGRIGPAIEDSPEWLKSFSAGIGRALKATRLPGTQGFDTGNITGEVAGKLAIAKGQAEEFWKTVDDRARIADFQASLKNSSALLNSNTNSLKGNSAGAKANREGLEILAGQAKTAAQAYANTTGKQSDYTAALRLAVPAIEAAATATGLNKDQVDAYLRSVGLIPPEKNTNVTVSGYLDALNAVNTFLASLAQIPSVVRVPIETFIASPTPANQLAGSAFGVDTVGRHAAGGVARGWSWVGERGPELVNFGSPSRVLNHQDSMAAATGGPAAGAALHVEHQTINNNVDVREVAQQVGAAVRTSIATRRL